MTCIAAVRDNEGNIWMGGDRCCWNNGRISTLAHPKIVRFDWMLAGIASSLVVNQKLRLNPPPAPESPDGDPEQYLYGPLSAWLTERCKESNTIAIKDGVQRWDAAMLVGMQGRIFAFDGGLGIAETTNPYNAVGSACDVAAGALGAMLNIWEKPDGLLPHLANTMVRLALEISAKHDEGVLPPFDILQLKRTP